MKTFNEFRKEIEIQHANIHLDEGLGVVLAATTAAAGYGAYKIGRAALLVISAIATQLNDIIAAKWRRANGVSKAASQKCKYASGFDGGSKQYKKCILSAYIDGAKDKIDILMQMKSEVSNKFDDEKANLYHKTIEAEIVKLKNKIGKWEGQIEFIDSHLQKWESVKIEGDILESKDPESYQKVTLPIHPLDLIDFDKHVTSVSKKHKISIENLLSRIGNLISTYKKRSMKLLTETFIAEAVKDSKKGWFIEGVYLQGNLKNKNGRYYPKPTLDEEVNRYIKEYVEKNRAVGELNHPATPSINLDRVSHRIIGLIEDGNNWIGRAQILHTPMGNVVMGLLEGDVKIGVSSRGLGSLRERNGLHEVQNDFKLSAVDIVSDPSAPDAYVNGLNESADWIFCEDGHCYVKQDLVEQHEKIAKEQYKSLTLEQKALLFSDFLNNIKG